MNLTNLYSAPARVSTGILSLALFCVMLSVARAGEVSRESDTVMWKAGIDGLVLEWHVDGRLRRVSSLVSQPVQTPDKRGVKKAQRIAEEKAKNVLVRFRSETSFGWTVVHEAQEDLETARTLTSSEGQTSLTKENVRTMTESLEEVVGSFAMGSLAGIVILERGYNADEGEAWVRLGYSDKSVEAAQQAGQLIQGSSTDSNNSSNNTSLQSQSSGLYPSSYVERLNDPNW